MLWGLSMDCCDGSEQLESLAYPDRIRHQKRCVPPYRVHVSHKVLVDFETVSSPSSSDLRHHLPAKPSRATRAAGLTTVAQGSFCTLVSPALPNSTTVLSEPACRTHLPLCVAWITEHRTTDAVEPKHIVIADRKQDDVTINKKEDETQKRRNK